MGTDGRIVDSAPYGQHIPLTCINHSDRTWSTKNIAPIGARSIFYNLYSSDAMPLFECDCPLSDLRPVAS